MAGAFWNGGEKRQERSKALSTAVRRSPGPEEGQQEGLDQGKNHGTPVVGEPTKTFVAL